MTTALSQSSTAVSWEAQAFETAIAGAPVGRLTLTDGDLSYARQIASLCSSWKNDGVWLVSCRIPIDWQSVRGDLETNGFRPLETLVTFYQSTKSTGPLATKTGLARTDEFDACVDLALSAFTFDRLHRDPQVPDTVADAIRAAWVRNDLAGRAAAPLVTRVDGRVVGFNLCLKHDRLAVIDLIAVAPEQQRKGIAAQLVEAAFGHFGASIDGIRVGTQADNLASMKLYERTGFIEEKRETTLHWVNPQTTPGLLVSEPGR